MSAFTAAVQGREGNQLFVGGWRQTECEAFIIFKNYVCMINVSMCVYVDGIWTCVRRSVPCAHSQKSEELTECPVLTLHLFP